MKKKLTNVKIPITFVALLSGHFPQQPFSSSNFIFKYMNPS